MPAHVSTSRPQNAQICPENNLKNVKNEFYIVKLHFVLLLALKSSHLAAIVFLKLTVKNIYATGNLIVVCFEDLSFCGKL